MTGAGAKAARFLFLALLLPLILAACGGGDDRRSGQIEWRRGTPAGDVAAADRPNPTPTPEATDDEPTSAPPTDEPDESAPRETDPTAAPTPADEREPGARLTAAELDRYQPNELGKVPILEYHHFVTRAKDEAQFYRPLDDFRADLEWLYEHDFYVVPLHDVITNDLDVPAGKHPVALTFDDSYASQFRFLIDDDGATTIDPDSAVGILEAFFAERPDFGRGGFFAVIPSFCFDWLPDVREDDQTPYCAEKISWLLDHGYEVGNHTLDHVSLYDVDDATFKEQLGGAIEALQAYDERVTADIIAMTFGDYPDKDKRANQRQWLRDGFDYNGREVRLLGCLQVGAEWAPSPVSTDWDSVYIPRIQAADIEEYGYVAYWFPAFAASPELLYTSDGNPDTITIPEAYPGGLGDPDEAKIAADGKELIRY